MIVEEVLRERIKDLELKNDRLNKISIKEKEEKQQLLNNIAQERNRWCTEKIVLIKANMKLSKMLEEINIRINGIKK